MIRHSASHLRARSELRHRRNKIGLPYLSAFTLLDVVPYATRSSHIVAHLDARSDALRKKRGNTSSREPRLIPGRSLEALQGPEDEPGIPGIEWGFWFEDKTAREAQRRLTNAGVSPRFLELSLSWIEKLARDSSGRTAWHLPRNMTRKKLSLLPKRIRRIADTVQSLNAHRLYDPAHPWLRAYKPSILRARTKRLQGLPEDSPHSNPSSLLELPERMRAYADYLRARVGDVGKKRKGIWRGEDPGDQVKREVLELIVKIKDVTGEHCWTELSNLLQPILGDVPFVASAESLRVFYKQNEHHCVNL